MTYTLYSNGVLEKDGDFLSELSPAYDEYLAWLALGNTPIMLDGSVYLNKIAQIKADKQQLKQAYENMLTRLTQIQTAGIIPFTQAGFNQVVQAVKDEALYIERIMKVLARLI